MVLTAQLAFLEKIFLFKDSNEKRKLKSFLFCSKFLNISSLDTFFKKNFSNHFLWLFLETALHLHSSKGIVTETTPDVPIWVCLPLGLPVLRYSTKLVFWQDITTLFSCLK